MFLIICRGSHKDLQYVYKRYCWLRHVRTPKMQAYIYRSETFKHRWKLNQRKLLTQIIVHWLCLFQKYSKPKHCHRYCHFTSIILVALHVKTFNFWGDLFVSSVPSQYNEPSFPKNFKSWVSQNFSHSGAYEPSWSSHDDSLWTFINIYMYMRKKEKN